MCVIVTDKWSLEVTHKWSLEVTDKWSLEVTDSGCHEQYFFLFMSNMIR